MDGKIGKIECNHCTDCGIAVVKKECSATSDTICNELCEPGKTYSKTGFAPCTKVNPCTVKGIDKVGTYRSDNVCKMSCNQKEGDDKWGIDSEYGPPCYDKCKDKQYYDNGYEPNCLECQTCDKGKTKISCGTTTNSVCKPDSPITPKDGKCPEGYYKHNDDSVCYKCDDCKGSAKYLDCTATTNTKCINCGKNKWYGKSYEYPIDYYSLPSDGKVDNQNLKWFSNFTNHGKEIIGCHECTDCRSAGVATECTATSDTVCNALRVPGKTWSETGFAPCKPVVVDCSKKGGIEKAASYLNDNICKLR